MMKLKRIINDSSNNKLVLLNQTTVLIIIMALTKGSSFIRDIILTNTYGASCTSDAFIIALSIPTILVSGLLTALYTSYIPVYKGIFLEDKSRIPAYNTNLIALTLLVSGAIIALYLLLDEKILKLLAAGFDSDTFALAKEMAQILIFCLLFMGTEYILQGYLQANGRFYLVAANTIPLNIITAIGIVLSEKTSPLVMPIFVLVGYAFCILYFGVPAKNSGFRIISKVCLWDSNVLNTIKMTLPIFAGQIIFEINSIVDKSVASTLPTGDVTVMDYAFKVMSISYAVIVNPIATLFFPRITDIVLTNDSIQVKNEVEKTLRIVSLIMFPVMFGVVICAKAIVEVLFFHGAFSMTAVNRTSEALAIYAFSIIPISLRMILEKVFYARKESRRPMYNSFLGIAINIGLDFALVDCWGHKGLAFATTASSIATFAIFLIDIHRTYQELSIRSILLSGLKYCSVSAVIAFAICWMNSAFVLGEGIGMIIVDVLIASLAYVTVLVLLRDELLIGMGRKIICKRGRKS